MVKKTSRQNSTMSVPKKKAKQDEAVIGTNDYSIVSKRSVEKLYYPDEPEFLRAFVGKFKRRAPLINRGYWLRMKAIEHVIKSFLDEPTTKRKVIINLGCGYEPLPFRMLWKYKRECRDVKFIDVDFPQLMEKKLKLIQSNPNFTDLLSSSSNETLPLLRGSILFENENYAAVGCDLGDISRIRDILKSQLQLDGRAILFLAEVSMVYMEAEPATELIKLCGEFENARFCMLEQHLPAGEGHPFAKTMIDHFRKQTPLRALDVYPTMNSQSKRLKQAGWPEVCITDLWSLWQDKTVIDHTTRRALNEVEPFDEWEELALFAGHYFLLWAKTTPAPSRLVPFGALWKLHEAGGFGNEVEASLTKDIEIISRQNPRSYGMRRFGAILGVDKDTFANHGGLIAVTRQTDSDVYSTCTVPQSVINPPESLMCHTMTRLTNDTVLLVGGRRSPASASPKCYLRKNDLWTRTHDLLPARYRHCSVRAMVGSKPGVLTFGGRTSTGEALNECRLFDLEQGWQVVNIDWFNPRWPNPGNFGAAMVATKENGGILLGGMTDAGEISSQCWEWELIQKADGELKVECKEMLIRSSSSQDHAIGISRLGARLVSLGNVVLVIGGVGPRGVLSGTEEILSISKTGVLFHCGAINELSQRSKTRPMLIGHDVHLTDDGEVIIVGGGGVCFSFGVFWNESLYILRGKHLSGMERVWRLVTPETKHKAVEESLKNLNIEEQQVQALNTTSHHLVVPEELTTTQALIHATQISHVPIITPDDFKDILSSAKPAVISDLDLGPCGRLWTTQYLKDAIGPERPVVIHSSSEPHLSFATKNFKYETQPFGTFIDAAMSGSYVYLRALSSENPSKLPASLERDFPGIAKDFIMPPALKHAAENEHSSVLRVSGKTTMWLHYDVMANVLCQIRGSKRVILFPPSDISLLKFGHGETTSGLNVFTAREQKLRDTHPVETILKEGEVLFIPACWAHATAPVGEGGSVAVNVFFKSFGKGAYAAGRDVYGNRDLEVYQNGRRDVERIVMMFEKELNGDDAKQQIELFVRALRRETTAWKGCGKGEKEIMRILCSVEGLPEDIGKFYLSRLTDELVDTLKLLPVSKA